MSVVVWPEMAWAHLVSASRPWEPDPCAESPEDMATTKLHADEVDIDGQLVGGLVATQFPQFAELPVEAVASTGTVNAIYRLGDNLCVRLPRSQRWVSDLGKELEWLPELAPRLSLAVPEPVARGEPGAGYPYEWAIYRWLEGNTFATDRVDDQRQVATDLAEFIAELGQIDPTGAPRSGRLPLRQLDDVTRAAIAAAGDSVDTEAVTAAWNHSLRSPVWDRTPVWRHCDLLPPNLLVEDGRLKAIIDFGGAGVGDSAADLIAAWSVLGDEGRSLFRDVVDVEDGTWDRARGFALHQALLIIPYYRVTNPGLVTVATRTVREVLADLGRGATASHP
jgi:aminoglycoside phosphotransferase (APT) family kinase protein